MLTPAEVPDENAKQPSPVIDIDGSGIDILNLLDQVCSPTPIMIPDWNTASAIIKLGKRYQFDHLPKILSLTLEPCLSSRPWDVFVFASQNDLRCLAKRAVALLANDAHWRVATLAGLTHSELVDVPLNYVCALVRIMSVYGSQWTSVDWKGAAEKFEIQ